MNKLLVVHKLKALACACICALAISGCGQKTQTQIAEPTPVGGPPLLRGLTESQYRQTITRIFGDDVPIVARFEPGLRSEGLLAIGTSEAGMSPFGIEQYSNAAVAIAEFVFLPERRNQLLACTATRPLMDDPCTRQFISDYGQRLFRRPLTQEQINHYASIAQTGSETLGDVDQGLKYALVGLLSAPEFLLRIEQAEPVAQAATITELDAYSKAERLAFFLTNQAPDDQLLDAARSGKLDDARGLSDEVNRLIKSEQYPLAVRSFFEDMLHFDLFENLRKDSDIYPAFNSQVAADAKEQTLKDITWHLLDNDGDYRDLFTLKTTHMTRALGTVYRQPVAKRQGWERVEFSEFEPRMGIQSHISFVALHSHPGRSSPTLRGMALREVFLCQDVPDPPADVNFTIAQETNNAAMPTARDRLIAHNTEPACSGCHKIMDPPGFGLEQYDGLGTFRVTEQGAVIDSSGDLDGIPYQDALGLAEALKNHRETPRCLAEQLYRYAVGRDIVWEERDYMDYLIESFAAGGYQLDHIMRTIALSENFFAVTPPDLSSGNHEEQQISSNP